MSDGAKYLNCQWTPELRQIIEDFRADQPAKPSITQSFYALVSIGWEAWKEQRRGVT